MGNSTLLTAEEFIDINAIAFLANPQSIMIEFAKLHVEAALKEINKKSELIWENDIIKTAYENSVWINEDSIKNAYSLDNIK